MLSSFGWIGPTAAASGTPGARALRTPSPGPTPKGNDLFTFPQVGTDFTDRRSINDDQRHRVVANFVLDMPYLAGIQFSGLATFATASRSTG